MFRVILIIILFFTTTLNCYNSLKSQTIFHQDVFYGGVTAGGFSTGQGSGSGIFSLYIEPGSTIKKAYLFTYRIGFPPSSSIIINGVPYLFDTTNILMQVNHKASVASPISLFYFDFTNSLNTNITANFNVSIPDKDGLPINWGYWTIFIYIEYENPALSKTATSLWINDKDFSGNEIYNYNNLMPINNSNPVSFSLYSDRTADTVFNEGYYTYINSNLLGVIGGTDNTNNSWSVGGVKGHFYYQNNALFGLDDDTSDSLMGGSDGLADIKSYINNYDTAFDFQLIHQKYPNNSAGRTNVNLAEIITYTTPCDTFTTSVTKDTTICYGETLQLQATGGQSYEWAAVADSASGLAALSCTDCPNPVFSGNSSQVYTVRIWNNDSCSVVKSVRVNVSNPQYIRCYTGETKCGASNGYIQAIDLPSDLTSWHVVSFNGDTLDSFIGNTLPNLEAGDYSVHYIDNFGCKSNDTIVTVEPYNNTVADFSVNPPSGMKPLEVFLENQSQNATDFEWFLNGVSTGTTPITFFDSSGVYEISLTAWELDPSCADTTSFTVIVFDSLVVTLPNVFTPNGDGVNDFFNIETNLPVVYELSILNRWGNVLFENNGKLVKGTHNLWDGKTKNSDLVTDGTYFYIISFQLDEEEVNCEITECEVRKEGFVQVFGK